QVAKSQDFPAAFTFVVSIALAIGLSHYLYNNMAGFLVMSFGAIKDAASLEEKASSYIISAIQVIFLCSLPIMVITSFVGVLVNFLIIGPLFSMEALKPDVKRLNP